jgi:predicted nucleic acid-binding protein
VKTYYYLDASVWIKRYSKERGSERVSPLFEGGDVLVCATLGFVETCAAAIRKLDGPAAEEVGKVLDEIAADWTAFIRMQLSDDIAEHAAESAVRWKLKGADAVHLASALQIRSTVKLSGGEVHFVCADRRLAAAAQRAGLDVIDPTAA